MLRYVLTIILLPLWLFGCGKSSAPSDLAESRFVQTMTRIEDGLYQRIPSRGRFDPGSYSFWVDTLVPEQPHNKEVGIVWTKDDWVTQQTAYGRFDGKRRDRKEQWSIDVDLAAGFVDRIEYALFVKANGQTYWDPRNNYMIGALEQRKVALIEGRTIREDDTVWFQGRVKVANLAYQKRVTVHYQLGDSQRRSLDAVYQSGNDWTFKLPLSAPDPIELKLFLRYEVGGQTYLDDNDGKYYQYALGPHLTQLFGPTSALAGFELLSFTDQNLHGDTRLEAFVKGRPLKVEGLNIWIDSGAWFEDEIELELIARDGKGFISKQKKNFRIDRRLKPRASVGAGTLLWPRQLTIAGNKLLIADLNQSAYFRYQQDAQRFESIKCQGESQDLAGHSDGRIVLLSNLDLAMLRFHDAQGQLLGERRITAEELTLPVAIEANDQQIFVLSLYEQAVLVMDWEGKVQEKFKLPGPSLSFRLWGEELWMLTIDPNQDSNIASQHFNILDSKGLFLRKVPLPLGLVGDGGSYRYIRDFAVDDRYIVLLQDYQIVLLDRNSGLSLGKWSGLVPADGTHPPLGALSSTVQSVAVDGQSIYVADFGYARLQVFDILP